MAKAIVKCKFCGKQFDRNDPNIEVVKLNRRYAHKVCYDKQDKELLQEQEDQDALYQYIATIFGDDFDFIRNKKLIESYKEKHNFSYSGMLKALKWYYEIENGSKEKANGGVGILPYIYEQAYKYYFDLYQKQQQNAAAAPYNLVIQTVNIPSPRAVVSKPKLFDLGDE